MWVIRFHKLRPKHYNLCRRFCRSLGFIPRHISPTIFIKALILHTLDGRSWRSIGAQLGVHHIPLYTFSREYGQAPSIRDIFHAFATDSIIVYIADTRSFSQDDLDNSPALKTLTFERLKYIFSSHS